MLPRLPELAREVAEIANGVVAAARAGGRTDLAELVVSAASRWSLPGTTVAVVGESGVGKTALVNALVGRAVLPTRDLAPSVLAVVTPGADRGVTAVSRSSEVPLELDPGAIAGWLEAQGPMSDGVTSLALTVDDMATGASTTLVDTRGGTGRSRAIATAQQCDVLLFVTDADSPLTQPELDLLQAARGTAGKVVVVLSRIDRFRGWQQIQAADQALVPNSLVLPVSSTLALAAQDLRGRDDDEADVLDEESGILGLRATLQGLADRTREVRLLGLLSLASQVGQELPSGDEPDDDPDQLRLDRAALVERAQAVQLALGDETNRLRESLLVEVKRAANAALTHREEWRAARRMDEGEDVGPLLEELDVARLQLEQSVVERTDALAGWLLAGLEGTADASPVGALVPMPGRTAQSSKDRSMRLRFAAALLSSGSGVVLLSSMLVPGMASPDLRPTLMSLGMMSGGLSALVTLRHSGSQKAVAVMKQADRVLVDEWQAVTAAALRSAVQTAQRTSETALRSAVADGLADLDRRLAGISSDPGDTRVLRAHLARAAELLPLLQEAA